MRSFLEDFHGLFKEKITLDQNGAQLISLQEGYEPNIFCILTMYEGDAEETEDKFALILKKICGKLKSEKKQKIIDILLQQEHILCLDPTDQGQSHQRIVAILESIRQEALLKAAHFNMTIPKKIKSLYLDQPDILLQEEINAYKAEFMALSGAIYDEIHNERAQLSQQIQRQQRYELRMWVRFVAF